MQRVRLPVAGRFAFPFANTDNGVTPVLAGFHPIPARLEDGERLIGRVDLKDIVAAQMSNADADRSRTKLDLRGAIVEVKKGNTGIAVQIDDRRS